MSNEWNRYICATNLQVVMFELDLLLPVKFHGVIYVRMLLVCMHIYCIYLSLLVFVLIFSYAMVISFGVSSYLYVAFFYCEVDGSSLCLQCDMLVHVGGKRTHCRYLLLRQRVEVCELPKEPKLYHVFSLCS